MTSTTAWALTTGEAGMRTQARGLAKAIADQVVEKVVHGPATWPLSPFRRTRELSPPWPDVIVSCGRRSVGAALAVRKASGGHTLAVHVQDPRGHARAFDLIIAMNHDRIEVGETVMKVPTSLHDLTPESLEAAARLWAERLSRLGQPLVGVMLGGSMKGRPFTRADGDRLIDGIRRLRGRIGGGLAITPSRRTPREIRAQLAEAFASDPAAFLWNMSGENPYRAILALSDRLIVTSDSVSMVSEALSTDHPVDVFDLDFVRHRTFIQDLVDQGLVRRFDGHPSPAASRIPYNATNHAADAVRRLLQARTRAVG